MEQTAVIKELQEEPTFLQEKDWVGEQENTEIKALETPNGEEAATEEENQGAVVAHCHVHGTA